MEYQRSSIRIERNLFGVLVSSCLLVAGFTGRTAPSFNKQAVLADEPQETAVVEQPQEVKQVTLAEPIKQITAEVETEVQPVAPKPTAAERPPVVVATNEAMQFIFQHESSNNPFARNASGCLGLGQACPGSKLLAVCPDLGNVQCQIDFFTSYAVARYGGWDGAYRFWVANHWW